jgi:hypothetical protein
MGLALKSVNSWKRKLCAEINPDINYLRNKPSECENRLAESKATSKSR